MRIRVFRAPRTADAIAQVRATLGPEAVILDTRRVGEEVEVTAALEAPEPVLILPESPPPQAAAAPDKARDDALAARLAWHNLPPDLALRLAPAGRGRLAEHLAAGLAFAPLPDGSARPLLLAGPPGAGKTLACAKLATRAVLAGRHPLVISADAMRAGATEQMAAFTRLLGLPLALAAEPGTLVKALALHPRPGEGVLIDTAGCDPLVPEEAQALLGLARAAGADVVLVLPAGLDAAEAGEIAAGFAAIGAAHLLPTRLDQARRLGSVLAAAERGLALTEAGTGAAVTGGLTPITPEWLAARLLGDDRGRHGQARPARGDAPDAAVPGAGGDATPDAPRAPPGGGAGPAAFPAVMPARGHGPGGAADRRADAAGNGGATPVASAARLARRISAAELLGGSAALAAARRAARPASAPAAAAIPDGLEEPWP